MKKKNSKINDSNILGVTLQFVFTIIVVMMGIISLFFDNIFPYFEIVMALDLFIMAFNNYRIYKKPYLTIVYIVFCVFLIISSVLSFVGVI